MSEQIPIPSHAIEIARKIKASNSIQKLQLENILLKHLVATIDPHHDYLMDLDKMTLTKVKHEQVQSGTGKASKGQPKSPVGGETRGFNISDKKAFTGEIPGSAGEGI